MLIGYCRVSTSDQNLSLQKDELTKFGCSKIYEDVASGTKVARVGLEAAIDFAREGDALVIWKLDRLGRSLRDLIEIVNRLEKRGVSFVRLTQNIDTRTPNSKLFFHIFGALAEYERELIRERTKAGLTAERASRRDRGSGAGAYQHGPWWAGSEPLTPFARHRLTQSRRRAVSVM